MYLLSLTIIGDMLYFVSYSGQLSTAIYTVPFVPLARKYAILIGLNVALVWIYTLLCTVLLKTVEAKYMEEGQSMEEAQDMDELLSFNWIRDIHTGPETLRLLSLVLYGLVFGFVGLSIVFDVSNVQDNMLVL